MTARNRWIIAIALLIPIPVYAYLGRFSRLMADDYCYAINTRAYGFPAVIPYYYDNWFGRLTQIVGTTVGTTIGVGFAEIFPALLLLIWLVGLLWLCYELTGLLKLDARIGALIGAALILYATLAGTPQIFHSLYWISGVFPYTVPLAAISYSVAIILRIMRLNHASPLAIFACIISTLIAAWSCEPFSLALAVALIGALIGVRAFRPASSRALLTILIPTLIASIIALIVMVAAPGNTLREGLFTGTHSPITLAFNSVVYAIASLAVLSYFSPPAILLALLVPAVIAYAQPPVEISTRTLRRLILLTVLVALGLLVVTEVPAIYATSTAPPARALIIPQFVLICAYGIIGYLIGLSVRKSRRQPSRAIFTALVALLLIVGPLLTTGQLIAVTPTLNTYASEWDQRDQQIRAAAQSGEQAVEVAPVSIDMASVTGLDAIGRDPTAFPNACAATYYEVKSLAVASS